MAGSKAGTKPGSAGGGTSAGGVMTMTQLKQRWRGMTDTAEAAVVSALRQLDSRFGVQQYFSNDSIRAMQASGMVTVTGNIGDLAGSHPPSYPNMSYVRIRKNDNSRTARQAWRELQHE